MSPWPATRTRNPLWARMAARLTGRSAVAVLVAALVVGILVASAGRQVELEQRSCHPGWHE